MRENRLDSRTSRWSIPSLLAALLFGAATSAFADATFAEQWGPAIGTKAPLLAADDQDGQRQTLQSLTGTSGLLVVFNRSVDW